MWGHTFTDEGEIDLQFQIIRRSIDVYICKLYSWETGRPTECVFMNRAKILGLKLYESSQALANAYERHEQQRELERQAMAGLMLDLNPSDATAR